MKKKLILSAAMLLIIGCATEPQKQKNELLLAQKTFLGVIKTLSILKEAGKFTAEETDNIRALINSGDRILDLWTDAILAGKEVPDEVKTFEVILEELIKYKMRGQNG